VAESRRIIEDGKVMSAVTELSTPDDLDRFLASTDGSPVLLYKHSLTCGTSGVAFEEIREALPSMPSGVRVGLVKVQPARAVSNLIAERFAIRHESPQVILVHEGRVAWHASHFRVTADAILAALDRLGQAAT
jgi:bacillithiol system protein YtxJ